MLKNLSNLALLIYKKVILANNEYHYE